MGAFAAQHVPLRLREKIDDAVEIGLWEQLKDLLNHLLRARIRSEPVMHECYAAKAAYVVSRGWGKRYISHGEISSINLAAVARQVSSSVRARPRSRRPARNVASVVIRSSRRASSAGSSGDV
jgi:hypothetical protein